MKQASLLNDRAAHVRLVRTRRERSYKVALVDGFHTSGGELLGDLLGARAALLVTTPTVARLYANRLMDVLRARGAPSTLLKLPCDEASKSSEQVLRVCQAALDAGVDRRGVLIGFGGGVCTDIVTLAASLIRRGITHVRIPTTLTGQIDAGIGIKGAVNFGGKKSYLGCFHAPQFVIVDPTYLHSLPVRHLLCGLAEIIKMAIVRDGELFARLESHVDQIIDSRFAEPAEAARHVLWKSIRLMLDELEPNIHEDQTYKRLVDFGHFFSPLLEAASGFSLLHGEAVSIDMALTAAIAAELGLLADAARDRIIRILERCGLPLFDGALDEALCAGSADEAVRHRGGAMNMVVPTGIGQAGFIERREAMTRDAVRRGMAWLQERANPIATSCEVTSGIGGAASFANRSGDLTLGLRTEAVENPAMRMTGTG